MMTDPLADMLTRIRNAYQAGHADLACPSSQLKLAVARVLVAEGFLAGVEVEAHEGKARLRVRLRYGDDGRPDRRRAPPREPRPGRRVYVGASEIPRVRSGLGTAVLSTPKGILSDRQRARRVRGRRAALRGLVAMSRIGRRPVEIPKGVSVEQQRARAPREGPEGHARRAHARLDRRARSRAARCFVARQNDRQPTRAAHGLARALVANMVQGVTQGFTRELEIQGVGYRAEASGQKLKLTLGFSHPVNVPVPAGLKVSVAGQQDPHRGRGQAARRPVRRERARAAAAGALQGQGRPLRRRARSAQGRQGRHRLRIEMKSRIRDPKRAGRLARKERVRRSFERVGPPAAHDLPERRSTCTRS